MAHRKFKFILVCLFMLLLSGCINLKTEIKAIAGKEQLEKIIKNMQLENQKFTLTIKHGKKKSTFYGEENGDNWNMINALNKNYRMVKKDEKVIMKLGEIEEPQIKNNSSIFSPREHLKLIQQAREKIVWKGHISKSKKNMDLYEIKIDPKKMPISLHNKESLTKINVTYQLVVAEGAEKLEEITMKLMVPGKETDELVYTFK